MRYVPPMPGAAAETAGPRPSPSAAILFADIVGFTRLCETLTPQEAFAVLAGFHQRMAHCVATREAAICDVIGDSVMAVWAGPSGEENAAQALSSAFAMLDAMRRWAAGAHGPGETLRIGIGLHCGPVMTGRTGAPLHAKLSAFGDAVNVAHRLERLTRSRAAALIASDVLLRAARTARPGDVRLACFHPAEPAVLPGRDAPVRIRVAHL